MNEKLKFPLKLKDGTIITTIKELETFFIKRERKINESYTVSYSNLLSSGLNGYGLDLI